LVACLLALCLGLLGNATGRLHVVHVVVQRLGCASSVPLVAYLGGSHHIHWVANKPRTMMTSISPPIFSISTSMFISCRPPVTDLLDSPLH
jgi:hypothetical protein